MVQDVDIYEVEGEGKPGRVTGWLAPGWYIRGSEYLGPFDSREDAEFMYEHVRGRRHTG